MNSSGEYNPGIVGPYMYPGESCETLNCWTEASAQLASDRYLELGKTMLWQMHCNLVNATRLKLQAHGVSTIVSKISYPLLTRIFLQNVIQRGLVIVAVRPCDIPQLLSCQALCIYSFSISFICEIQATDI